MRTRWHQLLRIRRDGRDPNSVVRRVVGGAGLATALSVIWGGAFVVQRAGLRDFDSLWFAAGRAVLAAAVFAPALWGSRQLSRRDHVVGAALGATNVAGFFALQLEGIRLLGAGPSAAIIYSQPMMVLLLATILLRESLTRVRLIGTSLGMLGVAIIATREWSTTSARGVIVLLLAALSWAMGTVVLRAIADRPLIPLLALQMLYGSLPLLAIALLHSQPPHFTWRATLSIAYAGVLATALGWLLLALLLRRRDAASVSATLYFVPVL